MRSLACLALAVVSLPFGAMVAEAQPPFYFHKADVERQAFADDFAHCRELASGVETSRYQVATPGNLYAVAASSLFAGFFGARERRGIIDNVMRTCMADKGYRRVEASRETMKTLKKLDETARADRLFDLAATPAPEGKLLPR